MIESEKIQRHLHGDRRVTAILNDVIMAFRFGARTVDRSETPPAERNRPMIRPKLAPHTD
jgi:hypothetical protein